MEFLKKVEAWRRDRETGEEGFTVAGIMMFGKTQSVTDQSCMPWFFPDYREHLSMIEGERWSDRIYPDGTWEVNLYQFFSRVYQKLSLLLPKPFRLADDGLTRLEFTPAHTAMREALANALIHARHNSMGNVVVDGWINRIVISNPGSMLVSIDEFYEGQHSVCRNPLIQKMFVLIGVGEKAGSGADVIVKGWEKQKWLKPVIKQCEEPERVEIELRIGRENVQNGELNGQLNGQLNESQEETLAFIRAHEGFNTTKIAEALNKPFRTIDKHIRVLLKARLIERRGSKKTGGYYPVGTGE